MNSTHVKIGNVWWPRTALESARFVGNGDGVFVAFGLLNNGNDLVMEGQEAADLRAWLAGEPADTKAAEQVETLLFAMEDAAKVWDAWVNDDTPAWKFSEWLTTQYTSPAIGALFCCIHDAYHENR